MVAAALIMTSVFHSNGGAVQAATKKVGKGIYTITNEKKKEARFDRVSKKNVTSLSIPATVKIGKVKYKVVSIKANALKSNKKVKKLVIGKNVKKIGKKAFYNCKNLKSITIKSKKLASVGKKAFGRLNSKAVVTLPKMSDGKIMNYERMLKRGGLTGKNQVIKSYKPTTTDSSQKPVVIPDPEVHFAIGKTSGKNRQDLWSETTTDANFSIGDYIPLSMSIRMPYEMYGEWTEKKRTITGKYTRCVCGKCFENDTSDYGIHAGQTGHGGYQIVSAIGRTVSMWYWTPDNTPCSVSYRITLPEGLTYTGEGIANKLKVYLLGSKGSETVINEDCYTVVTDGHNVEVKIDNIKTDTFYLNKIVTRPIVVTFAARLNENATDVNQINADITYNCGGGDKTVNMNSVTIRKQ